MSSLPTELPHCPIAGAHAAHSLLTYYSLLLTTYYYLYCLIAGAHAADQRATCCRATGAQLLEPTP
eukprot:scaffold133181_cov27-Phaeocystis_antarctica.AAC.1